MNLLFKDLVETIINYIFKSVTLNFNSEMNIIKKIRLTPKSQVLSAFMLVLIVSYSFVFFCLFTSLVISLSNTIESITLPSGYLNATISSSQPEFEISFSARNTGFYEITDLRIELEFDVEFFENESSNADRVSIFQKALVVSSIQPNTFYEGLIIVEPDEFNLTSITSLEQKANYSRQINSLLSVDIWGRYFYHIILFEISLRNMELYIL